MTAADVAQLAYHLIKDYPEILEVTHQKIFTQQLKTEDLFMQLVKSK
jgi:D-alanyl-D-alanine carboxypeptidase